MNRLEEIKARVAKATPGPWGVSTGYDEELGRGSIHVGLVDESVACDPTNTDAGFIANSITDIPWLIAQLEAAETELSMMRATFSWMKGWTADEAHKDTGYGHAARDIKDMLTRLDGRLSRHFAALTGEGES